MKTIAHAMGITILKIVPRTPVNTAMKSRINPNLSSASNPASKLGGRMLCKTLPPSSGGISNRLNTPSATFSVKNTSRESQCPK